MLTAGIIKDPYNSMERVQEPSVAYIWYQVVWFWICDIHDEHSGPYTKEINVRNAAFYCKTAVICCIWVNVICNIFKNTDT